MTEFVSEVKTIPFNEDRIFNMLSDLSNLGKVQDRIPQDKIQDFEFDIRLLQFFRRTGRQDNLPDRGT